MKQGEIKETEGTFITRTQKVGVIKVPSKVKKSQYLISTCTNNPTSAIQIASFISNFIMEKNEKKKMVCKYFRISSPNNGALDLKNQTYFTKQLKHYQAEL